jgi:hypothetical protein
MHFQSRALPLCRSALLVLSLFLTGCIRRSFSSHGVVANSGPTSRDTWRSSPQGCTRDPSDGKPIGQSQTLFSLIWEDPGHRDPKLANRDKAPDAPLMLDVLQPPTGPTVVILHTRYQAGMRLDAATCSQLRITTEEHPAVEPAPRPALSGTLTLNCTLPGRSITAQVTFDRCEF